MPTMQTYLVCCYIYSDIHTIVVQATDRTTAIFKAREQVGVPIDVFEVKED